MRLLRTVAGLSGVVFLLLVGSAKAAEIKGTYKDWSVACDGGTCWVTTPVADFWIFTVVRGSGDYQTSLQADGFEIGRRGAIVVRAGSTTVDMVADGETAWVAPPGDRSRELQVVRAFRAANAATVSIGGYERRVSLQGYTRALEAAHRNSGTPYDPSVFSAGEITLEGGSAAAAPSTGSGPGPQTAATPTDCTDSEIEREINQIVQNGEIQKAGAGMKQQMWVTAEVLRQAIEVYERAQRNCGRDFSAAITQLRASREAALYNHSQL